MRRSLFYLFFLTLLACTEAEQDENEVRLLSGQWQLSNISGGLTGSSTDFNPGELKWNINLFASVVSVSSNLDENDPKRGQFPLANGVYSFDLIQQEEELRYTYDFIVEGERLGTLSWRQNRLRLDAGTAADGLLYVFSR
ncbi:hypothetical protein [Aureicoccus marinus]|uniref:Lipocalin-like domain-containing protein n=1 Tax=Aureicoccus marinus TaxID=754435 RepID=A0A2S7T4V6_9FLAO|nr:hypothetical protein [Aureicoccus marinus]PQJ14557.1 hypothetical protein BST99_01240 [Aureicoccus marinus]